MIAMFSLSISQCELANTTDNELQSLIECYEIHELIQAISHVQNGESYYSMRVVNQLHDLDRALIGKINILNELNRLFKNKTRFDIHEFKQHLARLCNAHGVDDYFIDETRYALYTFPVSHTAYELLISECIDDKNIPRMIETLNKACIFDKFKILRRVQTEHHDALASFDAHSDINQKAR